MKLKRTIYEIEDEEGVAVNVYELHLTANLIFGVFIWPRGWPWSWGFFNDLYKEGGSILHCGPVSFGYYNGPLP
jgi:hypothetical protein